MAYVPKAQLLVPTNKIIDGRGGGTKMDVRGSPGVIELQNFQSTKRGVNGRFLIYLLQIYT